MSENDQGQASAEAIAVLADAEPEQLAQMAAQISDEDLAAAMGDPPTRRRILDEIFGRMAEHVEPGKIRDLDAVIHFRITGAAGGEGGGGAQDAPAGAEDGGGEDLYEAVFSDGTVSVSREPTTEDPRLTIIVAPVPFLKLVTGQESGPVLFMKGRLKVEGDLMFASQVSSFFRIPRA